jgi:PPE-repeat protein
MTGKVTPFVNLLDPVAMAQLEATGGVPGELNALTLEDLTVEVAGAKLGGSGAFTFDNSDLQTFGGVPRPNGEVTLSLDGANGLIDKLIAMGVLTAQDAMGARMMMGMFAVPGDGPDSLTSSIRINEQGHVLANGMRIQ